MEQNNKGIGRWAKEEAAQLGPSGLWGVTGARGGGDARAGGRLRERLLSLGSRSEGQEGGQVFF